MKTLHGLDQALTFINCQMRPAGTGLISAEYGLMPRAVTISRQTGSGAHIVAENLAALLQARMPKAARPWTVFDRNLVERVVKEHDLPERMARFMREDRISSISDAMEELFDLHPPSELLVRKVTETILHLVELSNVIVIGRGATAITAKLADVFHVRIVGSLEKRVQHVQEVDHLSKEAALRIIQTEDRGRRRYGKRYFRMDLENPLLYHLVINTDLVSYDDAARIIAEAMVKHA